MWPFPKRRFRWTEPRELRRLELRSIPWWFGPLFGFFISGFPLAIAAIDTGIRHHLHIPRKGPPLLEFILIAIGVGQGLGLFMHLLLLVSSATARIVIDDKKLFREGASYQVWKLSRFAEFVTLDCHHFSLLFLLFKTGHVLTIGLPEEFEIKALGAFLCEMGLHELPPGFPLDPNHPIGKAWLNFCEKLTTEEVANLLPSTIPDAPPASLLDQTP